MTTPTQNLDELQLSDAQRRALNALYQSDGNKSAAADLLGQNERSYRRMLKRCEDLGWNPDDCPSTGCARAKPQLRMIKLDHLRLLPELQPRVELDNNSVKAYEAIYREHGAEGMDPIRAYEEQEDVLILTRGFTRATAACLADLTELPCEVYPLNNHADLLLDSLGGNKHGLQLNNADKNRAVKLYHENIAQDSWQSARDVAKLIGCSHEMVARYRRPEAEKTKKQTTPSTADTTTATTASEDLFNGPPLAPDQDKNQIPNVAEAIIESIFPIQESKVEDIVNETGFERATLLQVASHDTRLIVTENDNGDTCIALHAPSIENTDAIEPHKESPEHKNNTQSQRNMYMRNLIAGSLTQSISTIQVSWSELAYIIMHIGCEISGPRAYADHEDIRREFTTHIVEQLIETLECSIIATTVLPPFEIICGIFTLDYSSICQLVDNKYPTQSTEANTCS